MTSIDAYVSLISTAQQNGQGANKTCYLMGDYALLWSSFKEDEMNQLIAKTNQLSSQGVAVIPTIDYKITQRNPTPGWYHKGYIRQKRAPGETLYDLPNKMSQEAYAKRLTELSQKPPEFYDKFAQDWVKIVDAGLLIDPSKSSNFFYTPDKISFIDLNITQTKPEKETCFMEACCVLFNGMGYNRENLQKLGTEPYLQIIKKLSSSFHKCGADMQKMKSMVAKQYPDMLPAFKENSSSFLQQYATTQTER